MATSVERLTRIWETPRDVVGALTTVDHKTIGVRYVLTSFVFFALAGLEAAAMRWQLARPNATALSPEAYNQLFTLHGTTMMFFYGSTMLSGFSNYLIPLLIGARDMAFPRLNALSYWVYLLAGVFLYAGALMGNAPDGGWFAYVPLTTTAYSPGPNLDFYALSLLFLTISTTVGGVNFVVTIFKLRAPGMSINRMPIYAWSTLSAGVSVVVALPALTAALVFLELDRRYGTHFYDPLGGGSALLWQHLFWMFGHPWVYVLVVPAFGIVSTVVPTFARRPLAAYTLVALASVAVTLFGFGTWVHHMFATGLSPIATSFFSAASMTVSIPSGIAVAAWLTTIHAGRPVFTTAFLFMLAFLVTFVVGGLSGVMTGFVDLDRQVTDTYFVVAHLHYVLVGANVFPVLGAVYYWFPKVTGRLLSERIGRWAFWLTFVGFNVGFFPMHLLGLWGMPRRVYTYGAGLGWEASNMLATVGAYVFGVGLLVVAWDLVRSYRSGEPAGDNPWRASTLEWSVPSPPPAYNFAVIPTVRSRDPLWEEDAAHLTALEHGAEGAVLGEGRETPSTGALDGEQQRVMHMPGDSAWPLILALSLAVTFTGLIGRAAWTAGIGLAAVVLSIGAWFWPAGHAAPGAPPRPVS